MLRKSLGGIASTYLKDSRVLALRSAKCNSVFKNLPPWAEY